MRFPLKFFQKIKTNWYKALTSGFGEYLLLTNIGISSTLSALGDVVEQNIEMHSGTINSWNPIRTRNMAIFGIASGIICHQWYHFLDNKLPGETIKIVMKKIVLDQLICSPFYIVTMFVIVGTLEGKTPKEIAQEIKAKAWLLYTADWIIWPPAQFINFYILPLRYRVLYDNLVAFAFDICTSWVKHRQYENK